MSWQPNNDAIRESTDEMLGLDDALALIDEHRLREDWRHGCLAYILRQPASSDSGFFPLYRLFLCACCRQLDQLLTEERRRCLCVVERFARGRASFAELVEARDAAKVEARRVGQRWGRRSDAFAAAEAVRDAARNSGFEALLLSGRACRRAGLPIREQVRLFRKSVGLWATDEMQRSR